jgi:hypothetical protein
VTIAELAVVIQAPAKNVAGAEDGAGVPSAGSDMGGDPWLKLPIEAQANRVEATGDFVVADIAEDRWLRRQLVRDVAEPAVVDFTPAANPAVVDDDAGMILAGGDCGGGATGAKINRPRRAGESPGSTATESLLA